MIDSIAMLCCVLGFGLLSIGQSRAGFAVSAAGSVAWLMFAVGVSSTPLLLQSIAFLAFSVYGYATHRKAA